MNLLEKRTAALKKILEVTPDYAWQTRLIAREALEDGQAESQSVTDRLDAIEDRLYKLESHPSVAHHIPNGFSHYWTPNFPHAPNPMVPTAIPTVWSAGDALHQGHAHSIPQVADGLTGGVQTFDSAKPSTTLKP